MARGSAPDERARPVYQSHETGVSNAAASRIVGVNRTTGHRWRYGRSITIRAGEIRTYPAITRPAHRVSARFLSEAERIGDPQRTGEERKHEMLEPLAPRALVGHAGLAMPDPEVRERPVRRRFSAEY